ncbi:hypothetical protein [Streptomyces sp. NPDC055299]
MHNELLLRHRVDQHDHQWRRLYASRSGVEGTVNEFFSVSGSPSPARLVERLCARPGD